MERRRRADHAYPWWLAYTFDNPVRRLLHRPQKLLDPYIEPGMTVMDIGCGMGIFSIGMAKIVGDEGHVIAVDLQQKMLDILRKRAARLGVVHRIRTHQSQLDRIGIEEAVDFILAFWMVHEVRDTHRFLSQVYSCLLPGGKLLLAEPKIHVSQMAFWETVSDVQKAGFALCEEPRIPLSRAAVFLRA